MQSTVKWDKGSFRDSEGFVFFKDNKVFRTLNSEGAARMQRLLASPFFQAYMQEGKVIPTNFLENIFKEKELNCSYLLTHEKISPITYPYEWSFSMLKDAALLTLSLLKDALKSGFILKDGTAWNITFHRGKMCFLDILSINDYEEGQTWEGYPQFCQEFLYPLFLKSYKKVDFQPLFKGSLKGIDPHLMARLFKIVDWRLPGVFKHVFLNVKLGQNKSIAQTTLRNKFKLPKTSLIHMVNGLISLVEKLKENSTHSTWIDYTKNNTYEEEGYTIKEEFIKDFIKKSSPTATIIDLGCNTGHFSKIAATQRSVISCDIDSNCINYLYQAIRHDPSLTITPIVLDLMNPSPACGWNLEERSSIYDRIKGEGFLALALIHHLCIAQNVPLEKFVSFLQQIAPRGVVEWVSKEDPMVQFLLRNRKDIFDTYHWGYFEKCISTHFRLEKTIQINNGTRTLCLLEPKK